MNRPLVVNPYLAPVARVDTDLPVVDPARLSASALRARFSAPPQWVPEFSGDGSRFPGREPSSAAVLIPLVQRGDELHLLLTRRTDHLRDHAGQISFPGGRAEPDDADAVATALRETTEEIGLHARHIEFIGELPVYATVTAFQVTPVVALVTPPFELQVDEFEVAEAFEVPLHFLMNPAHHRHHEFEFAGASRRFMSMPWRGEQREYFIWGATAAMLRNLYRFLSA